MRPPVQQHVLSIRPFRRLWTATMFNGLGDWLNLLALIAMAALLAGDGFAAKGFAVGAVMALKLLPPVFLAPLVAGLAARLDGRLAMALTDLLRFGLVVTIPFVANLEWLLIAAFLVECAGLFWRSARDSTVPALVPKDRLDDAGQQGMLVTYGMAPVAGLAFAVVSLVSAWAAPAVPHFAANPASLALYVNAVFYLASAWLTFRVQRAPAGDRVAAPSVLRHLLDGRRMARNVLVRGLVIGLVGAFIAVGALVGVAQGYVTNGLQGGQPGFGVVFAALCAGGALGMFGGQRLLPQMPRRRMFGVIIVATGIVLDLIGLVTNLPVVVMLSFAIGALAGAAWIIGCSIIERDVEDEQQAEVFAFARAVLQVTVMVIAPIAPVLAGLGGSYTFQLGTGFAYQFSGINAALLVGGFLAVAAGFVALKRIDDRPEISLWADLSAAARGTTYAPEVEAPRRPGLFIAFEGGEGSGKTTQAQLLSIRLRDHGYDVVQSREPGATQVGMRLRAILLDLSNKGLSSRAEALLYAADRAEHVDAVIRPGLERGAIVISDRYVDSSLAYQGAGRNLRTDEIAYLSDWATEDLVPDLTILIDVPAEVGFSRRASSPADRIESEPREFHERVRREFRDLAAEEPDRYLVVDGTKPMNEISREIQARVHEILPDPVPVAAEDQTHTFQAIKD